MGEGFLCCVSKWLINVWHATVTNLYIFLLKILQNLWSRGMCFSIRLRKYLPIFVDTFLRKGGLNHIMLLFPCLLVLGLLLSLLLMLLLLLLLLLLILVVVLSLFLILPLLSVLLNLALFLLLSSRKN